MSLKSIIFSLMIVCCSCFALSCKVAGLNTTWKNTDLALPLSKNTGILVIVVLKDSGLAIRDSMAALVTNAFHKIGYQAVTSLQANTSGRLPDSGNEASYRALLTGGTDAVMTVALINAGKDVNNVLYRAGNFPADFYYNRITSYSTIAADASAPDMEATATAYWETILFDLRTLTPVIVLRSKNYYTLSALDMYTELPALIVSGLQKERIIAADR